MNSVHVNNTSLVYAARLVLIALFISYRQKLGLNRDMIISVVRAIIQLTIVGYLLKYIFALNNVLVTGPWCSSSSLTRLITQPVVAVAFPSCFGHPSWQS